MKHTKIAFSLLGLSSALTLTTLPLITSCTTSNIVRNNIKADEIVKGNASNFLTSNNPISGDIYYKSEEYTYQETTVRTISLYSDQEEFISNVECNDVTFNNDITIDSKTYTLTDIRDMAFSTLPEEAKIHGYVKFNKSIKSIGYGAFNNQDQVTKYDFTNAKLSAGISIGKNAFHQNKALTTVVMDDNLASNVSFGEACFEGCNKLTAMHFPRGTNAIGKEAFKDCESLSEVTFANEDTSAVRSLKDFIGTDVFKNCSSLKQIYVPKGTIDAYQYALNDILPSGCTIKDSYDPTPTPSYDSGLTTGEIILIVVGCVLGATIISLAIALPILKKQGKLKRKKRYKEPLASEDEALLKRELNKKFQVGKVIDKKCPVCKHPLMVLKNKKTQKFIACTNFPRCTFTESIEDEVRDFAAEKMR